MVIREHAYGAPRMCLSDENRHSMDGRNRALGSDHGEESTGFVCESSGFHIP